MANPRLSLADKVCLFILVAVLVYLERLRTLPIYSDDIFDLYRFSRVYSRILNKFWLTKPLEVSEYLL